MSGAPRLPSTSAGDGAPQLKAKRRRLPLGLPSAVVVAVTLAALIGMRAHREREAFAVFQAAVARAPDPLPTGAEEECHPTHNGHRHRPRSPSPNPRPMPINPIVIRDTVERAWFVSARERDAVLLAWRQRLAAEHLADRLWKIRFDLCRHGRKQPCYSSICRPMRPDRYALFRCSGACHPTMPLLGACRERCLELWGYEGTSAEAAYVFARKDEEAAR